LPAGRPGITATPVPEDKSVRLASVSALRRVTRAWEITLPDGSVTVTFSVANCCAKSWAAINQTEARKVATARTGLFVTRCPRLVPRRFSYGLLARRDGGSRGSGRHFGTWDTLIPIDESSNITKTLPTRAQRRGQPVLHGLGGLFERCDLDEPPRPHIKD
jgi:hypothetical protein